MTRNTRALLDAIIDAFMFLECSGDDEVDPDSAVRCMENMAASLLKLDISDQLILRSQFEEIAESQQDSADKEFIRELPNMIDLASSDAR